jgi:hypothetical protein
MQSPIKCFYYAELHNVVIMDNDGCVHNLSRYQAMWNKPRPESATIVRSLASVMLLTMPIAVEVLPCHELTVYSMYTIFRMRSWPQSLTLQPLRKNYTTRLPQQLKRDGISALDGWGWMFSNSWYYFWRTSNSWIQIKRTLILPLINAYCVCL